MDKYYKKDSESYKRLIIHSKQVMGKALNLAKKVKHLHPDLEFIKEAAMLHDIGIFLTNAQGIGCHGSKKYICHGYLGRKLLEKEGFPKHGLVCERHVGVGITKEEIIKNDLPLPKRDMFPVTVEEKIIAYADKFFTKSHNKGSKELSLSEVRKSLEKFGEDKLKRFEGWRKLFGA